MEQSNQKFHHLSVLLFMAAKLCCLQMSIGATLSLLRQPHAASCDCVRISDGDNNNNSLNGSWNYPNVANGGRKGSEFSTGQTDVPIGFLAGYVHSKVILGALLLAIENINNDSSLLPGRRIKLKPVDIGAQKSLKAFPIRKMTEMRDEGIVAFIGPDETCTTEALVASAWNIPMISYKCADAAVSDKTVYSSFARTLPPATKVSKSVVSLLTAYNWHSFSIVAGKHPAWSMEIAQAIKVQAESNNLTVNHFREYSDYIPSKIYKLQNIVDETYHTTRIYVFVGDYIEMVDFVRCLQNKYLLSNGDYMVVSIDDEVYDPSTKRNIYQEYSDFYQKYARNSKETVANRKRYSFKDIQERLQEAFLSVLRISPLFPMNPQYKKLCHQIKLYARQEPFRVPLPINPKIYQEIQVPIYAAHLYDAVLIYARAATEVIQAGGSLHDGRLIMRHILNRSYHSIQGFDVYIDENGDAEGNFTVIALQKDEKVNNSLNKSMQPVGMFVYSSNGTNLPEFKYLSSLRPIMWVKGRPPLAEPPCGFHGEKCRLITRDWRYITGIMMGTLFITIFAVILFKHYRYEQTLACLLWKVEMKDVTIIGSPELMYGNDTKKKLTQVCRQSILANGSDTSKRAFTNIGLYRGNIVAIKYLHKRSVDITRTICKELKQMRELRHENIITFIGASVDQGVVAILTSYSARGSLADVLANEDLSLDHMFVSSLVSDIVKGLIYLHDSDIGSHGSLRSTKILIDSRWVAQISDFGLHEFKSGQEEPNKFDKELRRSLWKAPEILRNPNTPSRGSQKGDVYSFGIVLYEIVGRKGPWGEINLNFQEIIARVISPQNYGIFRPPLRGLDAADYVIQCLQACWEEEPEDRPDIRFVRVKLKPMQAGLKPNIFDNMLAIMEKYAYNLEGIVQERTNQLTEEKKKTESLLLRMLPRSVAESLMRGERVEAECFDCVTIFFSDLVGFTELCAQSNPFEVVEMLNDLYTCCDFIISSYDVYKVETIGDAYMVVSGLPIRNGDRHAGEIASLALHLLNSLSNLEIRHRSGEFVQIRIGIHSGQCVAGVVGLKMPRYCLFGDTVNTASRMESTGEAMKIHISSVTYNLLNKIGGYRFEDRGLVKVKGKGDMRTFWLIGEDDQKRMDRFGSNEAVKNMSLSIIPDLICTPGQSQPDLQYSSRNPMYTCSNQELPFQKIHGTLGCYICRKRKIYQMPLIPHAASQSYSVNGAGAVVADESVCTCRRQHCLFDYYNDNLMTVRTIREPRSAPQITFMQ
ncbi:guanylate cyclase 32E [Armigeres subalbatus]|uniref:guanylate cyclase 32E n=1 Tax=Armigeres subalbatus TaxID=124917 RepID=UPI002ED5B506